MARAVKEWIGQLIETATLEMKIPRRSLGSTTWRREDLSRGLEPDRCYFIQNEARVRGRRHFDLRRDPPPDLAVEVQITHHPIDRLKIYAALGVGEILRFDGERVHFLVLRKNGRYTQSTRSVALPFLSSADVNRYIEMFETTDENSVIAAFREWLQEQR